MDWESAAGLGGSGLFAGIGLEACARDLRDLGCMRRSVRGGTCLHVAGERYQRLIILVSGSLAATVEEEGGRSLRVATLRAPDAVAPAILFAPVPVIPVSLAAESNSVLLVAGREAILALCRRRPRFLENLLGLMGSRIQGLASALRDARWSTLRQRLAAYLVEQARAAPGSPAGAAGQVLHLAHTREEIARLLGAERPSVSRSLGHLARDGFVAIRGREVRILDRSGLEALCRAG
jgi:CRP/FNR family transcriptional regulator, dissimilatory nitrate respiration regulator